MSQNRPCVFVAPPSVVEPVTKSCFLLIGHAPFFRPISLQVVHHHYKKKNLLCVHDIYLPFHWLRIELIIVYDGQNFPGTLSEMYYTFVLIVVLILLLGNKTFYDLILLCLHVICNRMMYLLW